jgi:ABC-type nitrate/sulfonate/bicarbonate transport system permease component
VIPAVLVIGVLEMLVRGGVVPAFLVPAPSEVARAPSTKARLSIRRSLKPSPHPSSDSHSPH